MFFCRHMSVLSLPMNIMRSGPPEIHKTCKCVNYSIENSKFGHYRSSDNKNKVFLNVLFFMSVVMKFWPGVFNKLKFILTVNKIFFASNLYDNNSNLTEKSPRQLELVRVKNKPFILIRLQSWDGGNVLVLVWLLNLACGSCGEEIA